MLKRHTRNGISQVLFLALLSRILVFSISFLRLATLSHKQNIVDLYFFWDGGWYSSILEQGYQWHEGVQSSIAFFPLYPLIAGVFSAILPQMWSLLVVSNASFFGAVIMLYVLTKKEFGEQVAQKTVAFFSFFPLSFVYSLAYTESLFLFFALTSVWFLANKRFWGTAFFALAASLTRVQSLLLVFPFAQFLYQYGRGKGKVFYIIFFPILGSVLYLLYLFGSFGDAFIFFRLGSSWDIHPTFPLLTVSELFIYAGALSSGYLHGLALFDSLLLLGSISLLWTSFKLLPRYLWLYALAVVIFALSTKAGNQHFYPFPSLNRYLMVAFPLYMVAAKLADNTWIFRFIILLFTIFLIVLSWNFFSGKWVV